MSRAAACATLHPMTEATLPAPGAEEPGFTAGDLAGATGGTLLSASARRIRGAAVDSRLVRPGQLFVALPGERTDGHRFLHAAAAAGASALVVREPVDVSAFDDVTIVRVADGLRAIHAVATAWRARFSPLMVGITGSIAKTSTKEAVAAVLGRARRTLKSAGNQNNEIGLPLTVLSLGPEHEVAVLEMGMYVGGEIADLARIARPDIGIVTAVQGVHLSRIGSIEAIERAKAELVEALPADGTAILNADDPRVRRMAGRTSARVLTYGFDPAADVTATDIRSVGFDGMRFTLDLAGERRPVATPVLGRLGVHNALAAAAAGLAAGIGPETIAAGLAGGWATPHRGALVRAGGTTVIDDTYNASPGSVRAALELLGGLPGRHVACLGEMLELGPAHDAGHREVGAAAAAVADLLIVVGGGAGAIANGAVDAGLPPERIVMVADAPGAVEAIAGSARAGDVILVKASRGAALEAVVDGLRRQLEERPAPAADPTGSPR